MAVKIRLARRGRKKMAMYDIVVAESTSPRDGRFIEKIGTYNPNTDPSTVVLKSERAVYWLMVGAQPTDTARSVLSHEGVMYRKHLQVGVNKGAISQEQADEKFSTWLEGKQDRKAGAADTKTQTKQQDRAARLDAEKKVNEARAEAIAKKNKVEEPAVEAAPMEVAVVEAPAAKAPVTEEASAVEEVAAPVAEVAAPAVDETPVAEAAPGVEAPGVDAPATDVTAVDEVPAPVAEVAPTEVVAPETAAPVETPVAEETPAPVAESAPVAETPVAEDAPRVEAPVATAPADDEKPTTDVAPTDAPAAE